VARAVIRGPEPDLARAGACLADVKEAQAVARLDLEPGPAPAEGALAVEVTLADEAQA
jgi:hypothetical protein